MILWKGYGGRLHFQPFIELRLILHKLAWRVGYKGSFKDIGSYRKYPLFKNNH